MFEKSKVKSYNRLSKSKSGFKVIRVIDFLRKKDENNTVRNTLLGVGAVIGVGGIALLLRKNINSKALLKKASNTPLKYPKEVTVRVKDVVEDIKPSINNTLSSNNRFSKTALEKYKKPEPRPIADYQPKKTATTKTEIIAPDTSLSPKSNFPQEVDPWTLPTSSKYADRGSKLLVKKPVNQNRVRAKDAVTNDPWSTPIKSSLKKESSELLVRKEGVKLLSPAKFKPEAIPDFWDTAITNKVSNSLDTVVKPNSKTIPLLTGKKIPASRGNIYGFDNRTARRVSKKAASDAARIDTIEKTYKSLSPDNLAMRATTKINHYLIRPRRTSNLGAPPKATSLAEIIDTSSTKNLSVKAKPKAEEKIIKKAQEKVTDRLSRAEKYQLQKKASNAKKN